MDFDRINLYSKIRYGDGGFARQDYFEEIDPDDEPTILVDLMRYLEKYWHTVEDMKIMQHANEKELVALLLFKWDVERQLVLETASWGLDRWEAVFGLSTDATKRYEFRRERIRAKMRGTDTSTKQMIINVSSAFANGEVEVIEVPQEYKFIVKFVGVKGIPPNMLDLTDTIQEIKPAHLAFEFEYTYNYWELLRRMTWGDARRYTWGEIRVIDL